MAICRVNSLGFSNFWYRAYNQNLIGLWCVKCSQDYFAEKFFKKKLWFSSKIEFSSENSLYVCPMFVCTKMSGMKRSSFLIPMPENFVQHALCSATRLKVSFYPHSMNGCVFPMVIWPAFRIGQYWVNNHFYHAPQFIWSI